MSALLAGVDLVHLPTLRALLQSSWGQAMLRHAWHPREVDDARGRLLSLAGSWAGKEATMKALGHGIGRIDPADIQIVRTHGAAPVVVLHRSARDIARGIGCTGVELSITHDGDYVAAFAVANLREEAA